MAGNVFVAEDDEIHEIALSTFVPTKQLGLHGFVGTVRCLTHQTNEERCFPVELLASHSAIDLPKFYEEAVKTLAFVLARVEALLVRVSSLAQAGLASPERISEIRKEASEVKRFLDGDEFVFPPNRQNQG